MAPLYGYLPLVPVGSLAASAALLGLAVYLRRHRGKPGANWFVLTLCVQAFWCLAYGVGLWVSAPTPRVALEAASLVGLAWVGPLFLAFALDYTGRSHLVRSAPFAGVLSLPVLTAGLLALETTRPLVWSDLALGSLGPLTVLEYAFGPWALFVIAVNFVCVAAAVVALVDTVLSYGPLYRREAFAVAVSTVPVASVLLLWLFRVGPYPYLSLGPLLSLPHAALDAYAFVGNGMFESNPTTQRAAERTAFEEIPNPILVLDPAERVVNYNSAAAGLFGFDGEALGTTAAAATGVTLDVTAESQSVEVDADDRTREFNVLVAPLTDPVGERVGYTVVFQDVTREREREQRLEVLNRVLRHNLRNEMTVILGFADFIVERSEEPEVRGWAETIAESGHALADIGEKAREFDALRGREPRLEATDADELVGAALDDLADSHPDAAVGTALRTERRPVTDPSFLRIALRNLLENAVEHGEPPVGIVVADASEGRVRIDVTDEGPGIPPGEYEPVLSGEESALDHGSGIGLWITKWIVAAVGGDLRFDGGDGTTVSVLLPGAPDADSEAEDTPAEPTDG
jgi:signal transduction histidine kinase